MLLRRSVLVSRNQSCALVFCSATFLIDRYLLRHRCLPVALIFCYRSRQRRFAFCLPCLLPQGRLCADSCCCSSSVESCPVVEFCAHLHFVTREVCLETARFCQARGPFLPASGRLSCSARFSTPRPSRRFAKRTIDQRTLAFPNTVAFSFHMTWWTAFFFFLSRPSRCFPSSRLGTALFRSSLSMPPGNLCHAGGWQLRSKPRAVVS